MRTSFSLTAAAFLAACLFAAQHGRAQDAQAPAVDAPAATDAEKGAEAKKDAGPADPNGTWQWERTFQDNAAVFLVRLLWDDKKLTGTYSAFGSTTDIEDGSFDKGNVSFISKREFNGNAFEVKFKGKVEGEEIRGNLTVDFGQGPQDFEWIAKRTVTPEDVLGVWKLRIESERGVIEPQITITRKGEDLVGAYESPFGKRDAKELKLKDGELSWEISGDAGGNQFKVVYKGKPRGNSIAGKSEFDFGGNTGETEFTGKRTPPKEDADSGDRPAGDAPASADAPEDKPADGSKRPPLEDDSNPE